MNRFLPWRSVHRLFRLPLRTPVSVRDDADEELDALIAARVDDLVARGLAPDVAREEAVRRLGMSIDQARRHVHQSAELRERRMRLSDYIESVGQDVRYALRGLVRRPAFTAVAMLTLAIGIGATTAIFSAVNVLLLRRLPYDAPDRLLLVSLTTPGVGDRKSRDDMVWSYPKFVVFRDAQQIFSDLALYAPDQIIATSGDVERLRIESVGARYLHTLGITAERGRDFDASIDAHAGAEKQAIISDALWQRRYNADPAIIGKTIELNRDRFVIIGITPPGFTGLSGQAELFIPITTRPAEELSQPQSHEFYLVGRLAPGVTVDAGITAVKVLGRRVHEAVNDPRMGNGVWGATARSLDDVRVAPLVRRSLFVLASAVIFVLLIACVNVANLLLGRASLRRREIAVRLAIGAGRARLARMLLAESLLLALLGGAAGVLVAWLGVHALSAVNPATLRVARSGGLGAVSFSLIRLDWPTVAFALGITLLVGVAFGLVPALAATRTSLGAVMKDTPAGSGRARTFGGRRALVVLEIALAVVLLAGSGLMLRSLSKLLAIDPGFDVHNVLTVRLTVPPGGISGDSLPSFYDQLLVRVRAIPGVAEVAIGNCAPLSGGCNGTRLELMDRPKVEDAQMPSVGIHWTSPTWFSALHVPLKRGRVFTSSDRLGGPKVVVINETAARRFWPNGDPLGKRVGLGQGGFMDGAEVIGVVGDVRQFVDSEPKPDVYLPYLQSPRPGLMLFVKTQGDAASLTADVRRALREVAPRYPVYDVQTLAARAASGTAPNRFSATLLALFAGTALALAAIGIYGVMSLAVSARTREIGVRIALGADRARVQRFVVADGLALVTVGASIGIAGALVSTRLLRSLLFDLTPADPPTYVAIVIILGACALTASWLPARRAASVDPMTALRSD